MENSNINIYALLTKVSSEEDSEVFKIKDFVIGNFYSDVDLIEVLTGEYSCDYLPVIDDIENIKEACLLRITYEEVEEYNGLDLNDLLIALREDFVGCFVDCKYEDDCLKEISFNFDRENSSEGSLDNIVSLEDIKFDLKDISKKIKEAVINQDEVVDKTLSNIVYNQKLYYSNLPIQKARLLKKNMLIFGKTGTGKTEVIRQVVDNLDYNIPYVIEDANSYTIDGYKGKDVVDMLRRLVVEASFDIEAAQHGILVIDEIDKKLPHGDSSDIASTGVQQALLKIIEGGEFDLSTDKMPEFNGMILDTSLISVILLGHFEGIYKENKKNVIGFSSVNEKEIVSYKPEDFVKLGMIPEFMGRINDIVKTNDVDVNMIKTIINKSAISPLNLEREFFEELGVKISFDDDFVTSLAERSLKKGTGARGIKSSYDEMMGNLNFEVLSGDVEEISFENGKVRKRGTKEVVL